MRFGSKPIQPNPVHRHIGQVIALTAIRVARGTTAMENVITTAATEPRLSGGPLVVEGRIVGINTAYVWQRGIAIPINKVKAIADRLMTGRTAQRAIWA